MEKWINGVCDRVDQLTAQLPYYQQLLAQRNELEPRYREILSNLAEEDADVIHEFYYLTTEMDYQKTQTAYWVGCSHQG